MAIARKNIVDEETPGFYHCTNRCVRRTFLCGLDKLTGIDYSHRKDWLEKRIFELCKLFAVELYAFAVMDNHYHAVLYLEPKAPLNWSKDEVAVFSCMAYVDLNPIRARITEKLEESNNTAIKKRLQTIEEKEPMDVQAYLDAPVTGLSNPTKSKRLPMSLKDYIELVEWTGKSIVYPNKSVMPFNIQASLHRLNLQQTHWLKQIEDYGKCYCHVVGPVELIREKAKQLNQKWLKGIRAAALLYDKPR